jgi:nudix-type nucleoside diphosphatase (YffH/AdpP family)
MHSHLAGRRQPIQVAEASVHSMPPEIVEKRTLHDGWCKVLRLRIRVGSSEVLREVEDHGRAVAVLPYDPVRRTALLIKLLRAPVLLTEGVAELLEAPAGLADETDPAETARRELWEETGLQLREVEALGSVWTMPGISTERMALFLARYSEADRVGAGGGLASEHENITVQEISLDELWARVQAGQILDMKTLTLILMLHARHPELFGKAAAASSP